MELMSIKLYYLLQYWQDVLTIKLLYIYDPFNIIFKTTNSSTSENLMPVDHGVLAPLLQCFEYSNTAGFTSIIIMRICNLHIQ